MLPYILSWQENWKRAVAEYIKKVHPQTDCPSISVRSLYLARKEKRWVVSVTRRLNGDGFLITAYQTDAIKEGESIWHR